MLTRSTPDNTHLLRIPRKSPSDNTARPPVIEKTNLIFLSLSPSVIAGKHCYVKEDPPPKKGRMEERKYLKKKEGKKKRNEGEKVHLGILKGGEG